MAVDVTETYQRYSRSDELDALAAKSHGRIFPRGVTFHRTVEESRRLNDLAGPRIIISSSGMLTGGRVLHHMLRLLPDAKNLLVLVGYQAAGTRGRAIQQGARTAHMHGEDIPVRAQVLSVEGLSAHADADELVRWLHSGRTRPRTVFLSHGEPSAAKALSSRIASEGIRTWLPSLGQEFDFEARAHAWQPQALMK